MPTKKGKQPLSVTHPELAKEADGWDPKDFTKGSASKLNWKCHLGHSYKATPNSRTSSKTGCSVCSNKSIVIGYNDLTTTHPELAGEADGWDPQTIVAGSEKKLSWKCSRGHKYVAMPGARTSKRKTGCPVCSNSKVLIGYNDLTTTHPELAGEADGWDPQTIVAGSKKKVNWICSAKHKYETAVAYRTGPKKTGCPICANQKLLTGFNDLATTHPHLAQEADGWDPRLVISGTSKKMSWKCPKGHFYINSVSERSRQAPKGCSICASKKIETGFNDLLSKFPKIAEEADGWDPSTVFMFSNKKKNWRCPLGHKYLTIVRDRTIGGNGCGICSNRKVLKGFNDLATRFPRIAIEAVGWDPRIVMPGSELKKSWRCPEGHSYIASPMSRTGTNKTGCPSCAQTGFDPNRDGYLYFLKQDPWGMYQIGITNVPDDRLGRHKRLGWELLELRGPMDGYLAQQWETAILRMLKAKGVDLSNSEIAGKFDGYSEAWSKSTFEVKSIKELMRLTEEFEGN